MAPAEKNEYQLARNYGLDISMPEANFAVASAAQKEYQKQCTFLYRDFMKNMNSYIKQEQKIKTELRSLKKQKLLNSQYSLYRTDGKDLFSNAKKEREMLLKNNELSNSFFDDICFNPWGLDSILDEDLIRPKTAPADMNESGLLTEQDSANFPPNTETDHVQPPSLAATLDSKHVDTHVAKVEHLLESQSHTNPLVPPKSSDLPSPTHPRLPVKPPEAPKLEHVPDEQDTVTGESVCDGEVDIHTERTRARNIVIDRYKFLELQKGEIDVKLRNKNGAFLIRPVKLSYDPTGVDAVFTAKDPSKERMALVRKKTNLRTPTASAELKINNRIAIQKSLVGKAAKKTTVAEIFNSARDRKTRHFRIISKTNKGEENEDEANKDTKIRIRPASSPVVRIPNASEAIRKSSVLKNRKPDNRPPIVIREAFTERASKETIPIVSREINLNDSCNGAQNKVLSSSRNSINLNLPMNKRNGDSVRPVARSTSQTSMESHDLSTSGHHRVTFARRGSHDLSHLNRSASSTSMREGNVQFMMSDVDMNNMLQRLIEGKGEEGDYSAVQNQENAMDLQDALKAMTFIKRLSRMSSRNKRNSPSEVASSTGTANTLHLPPRLSSRQETNKLIRDAKQKDSEYIQSMSSMRRRVALGASKSKSGLK
ncbi:uncharacterized protein LOC133178229 [Saccostrea echinata]|uniref:uncharacterized protein LOC133178229 n=1 Tax=Saccostrea echinata TaxID=191078 RepID=UPI002A809E2B|nr:uncharacterized protein LOC133178229 [Saccostrea echinata]